MTGGDMTSEETRRASTLVRTRESGPGPASATPPTPAAGVDPRVRTGRQIRAGCRPCAAACGAVTGPRVMGAYGGDGGRGAGVVRRAARHARDTRRPGCVTAAPGDTGARAVSLPAPAAHADAVRGTGRPG